MDNTPTPHLESDEHEEGSSDTLEEYILKASDLVDVLSYRLDSMQRALDRQSFSLEHLPIRIREDVLDEEALLQFLQHLSLAPETLTLGLFLKALNTYLIQSELVDLNDLEIYLSPLVKQAMNMDSTLRKVPYATLLWHIPQVFR